MYTIIIPVLKREGNPYLDTLLKNIERQTLSPSAVHLVVGDSRQGRAINYGVKQADTEYIATLDDDSLIDDIHLFKKLVKAMKENPDFGMGGAACEIPDFATDFQKRAMREIPRRWFPKTEKHIDSDMVQHPCLIMPREFFLSIGGEDEELIRGLDPVLRKKVRDAGKRVVIIANTWIYHLVPDSWAKLIKMYYRNGRGSAFAKKYYPDKVLELTDGFDKGIFIEKRPLWYRVCRRICNLLLSVLQFKFLKFSTDVAYIVGFVKEVIFNGYTHKKPEIIEINTCEEAGYSFKLFVHKVKISDEK